MSSVVTTLGHYELLERIGHGATGRVWRGRDLRTSESVAVKVLREELADDAEIRTRFVHEGSVLAGRNLPGVVCVRETVVDGDRVGLVMDLVDGPDLREVISTEAPLRPARACALASQIARSLHAAAEVGLVHRDVKPENVLLRTVDGLESTVLTDFGLARVLDESVGGSSRSRAIGTPQYVAPERFGHESVGPAADVYALGVILFEMVVGWRPFRAREPASLMLQHMSLKPVRPPRMDNDLWDVIERSLAKDPTARPGADDLVSSLKYLSSRLSASAALAFMDPPVEQTPTVLSMRSHVLAQEPESRPGGRKKMLVAAVAVSVLAIGSLAAAAALRTPATTAGPTTSAALPSPSGPSPTGVSSPGATGTGGKPDPGTTKAAQQGGAGATSSSRPDSRVPPVARTTASDPRAPARTSSQKTGVTYPRTPARTSPQPTSGPRAVDPKPPIISTRSLPNGTLGHTYSAALSGHGSGRLSWQVVGGALPQGISLSSSGQIGGGPLSGTGNAVFTVKLVDSDGLATTRSFSISTIRLRSDINGDGEVSCSDYRMLKSNFFESGGFDQGDLNHDGSINALDLSMMMSDWTSSESTTSC